MNGLVRNSRESNKKRAILNNPLKMIWFKWVLWIDLFGKWA